MNKVVAVLSAFSLSKSAILHFLDSFTDADDVLAFGRDSSKLSDTDTDEVLAKDSSKRVVTDTPW